MYENPSIVARRNRTSPDSTRGFFLTTRDQAVIEEVFLQRTAARRHLQSLGYFGSTAVANARLRRLFDAGYLRRTFVPTGAYATEAVYLAGRAAIPDLVARLGLERSEVERLVSQDAPMFLAHALSVMDVRVAVTNACREHSISLQWLSEPECRHEYTIQTRTGAERHVLKPDGALLHTAESGTLAFLEVDRGHVSCPQFAKCCASYRHYISRGIARETYGAESTSVFCITTGGERRMAHLAAVAKGEALPLRITSFDEVQRDPFAAVCRSDGSRVFAQFLAEVNL